MKKKGGGRKQGVRRGCIVGEGRRKRGRGRTEE